MAAFRHSHRSHTIRASDAPGPDVYSTYGYRRLAASVIALAVRDLESRSHEDRDSARTFLAGSAMLGFWCHLARIAPSAITGHPAFCVRE